MAEPDETKPTAETHITILCRQDSYVLTGAGVTMRHGPNNVEIDTWMNWSRDNSMRTIVRSGNLQAVPFEPNAPLALETESSPDRARFMR